MSSRNRRRPSIALSLANSAEDLEPRLLLSAVIKLDSKAIGTNSALAGGPDASSTDRRGPGHGFVMAQRAAQPQRGGIHASVNRPGGRRRNPALAIAPINGFRAYAYLKQISDLGPRPAGSAANTLQRQLVAQHFAQAGAVVREQPFSATDPRSGARVDMANLIGSWHPERSERVLIAAHYDTRPFPDQESDPARRQIPYIGANDGASGVAMLMEIANHLKNVPTTWGVDLVLFDGEELVYAEDGEYFLGSTEFTRLYRAGLEEGSSADRYKAALVLDMVGGANLQIKKEPYSLQLAPQLVQEVWSVARRARAGAFRNRAGRAVLDDHVPLNHGGIPAIDLIDFDYPYWHKAQDLPENCSPASLRQVGRVVTGWLSLPRTGRR